MPQFKSRLNHLTFKPTFLILFDYYESPIPKSVSLYKTVLEMPINGEFFFFNVKLEKVKQTRPF